MPKYPKNHKDVAYYVHGRKRKIVGSTKATSDFLALIHEENPALTILQLRELLSDRSKYIFSPEVIAVLDTHIKAGYGEHIPEWRY